MQASLKEIRILKQEEATLITLASKISDQLNRLKVEELALQNMVRLENEAEQQGTSSGVSRQQMAESEHELSHSEGEEKNVRPLDLYVNNHLYSGQSFEEEEEEEEEEEDGSMAATHDDIEQFVQQLK